MATPQESITTVSGRRCTRSRARTAATSTSTTEEPSVVTPTELSTSTTVDQAPQIQTSAVEPPPSSPPPSSNAPAEQPAVAPTTDAAVSSATGTSSPVPISSVRISVLAELAPSASTAVGQAQPAEQSPSPAAVPLQAAEVTSALPPSPAATGSDTVALAVPTSSPVASSITPPSSADPAASVTQSTVDAVPEQASQTSGDPVPSSINTIVAGLPQQTASAAAPLSSGDSAGIISPDSSDDPLTLPHNGQSNIGGIVGGVIGGVVGLAVISGLLFYCLRKRKTRASRWNEKRVQDVAFVEKMKAIPAALAVFFAKLKGRKSGPSGNSYQRHTAQSSVSSIYSTHSNGRVRSTSEPQGVFAVRRGDSVRSTSSKKSERNLLRKKPSSVSSNYRFPGIMEDAASQNKADINPFLDPEPPKNLHLLNPDPASGPITPLPAATTNRMSRDPFASLLDQMEDAPAWLAEPSPAPNHRRSQSSAPALRSNAASSVYPTLDTPFVDSSAPPVPTQAILSNQKRRSSMAYPAFNATSTAASRDSQFTFFGEPGPSRPGTNMFTPGLPTGRTVRQSDPFDLDRPEVLGFGNVMGRREVRASVTRQATRSKRTSSVGNWVNVADGPYGPYERDSAKPGPLWSSSNGNGRR